MNYRIRFKRWKEEDVFLYEIEPYHPDHPHDLGYVPAEAEWFPTIEAAKEAIVGIAALRIPEKAYDFTLSTLFLIRLFGKEWDNLTEGMLVESVSDVKAQILNDKLEVVETIRVYNPVWANHSV